MEYISSEEDDHFGGIKNDLGGGKMDHTAVGGDSIIKYNGISVRGDHYNDQEGGLKVCQTTPSVGNNCTTLDGRKTGTKWQIYRCSLGQI